MARLIARRQALKLALCGPAVGGFGTLVPNVNPPRAFAGRIVEVESFRDGSRTDDEILSAAFAVAGAGSEIRFGPGVTYAITKTFAPDLTDKPYLVVSGQDATIFGTASVGVIFKPSGTVFPLESELIEAITSPTRILKVSNTTGIQPGDLIQIASDELFDSDTNTGGEARQEMCRVEAVPDVHTVTLHANTWNTYSTTGHRVKIVHYRPIRNLTIESITLESDRKSLSTVGLQTCYFDGLLYSDVRARKCPGYGIDAYAGFNVTVIGCNVTQCSLETWENLPAEVGPAGYGFHTAAVHNAAWIKCTGAENRHSFDSHRSRNILIQECTVEHDKSSGISTHGVDTAKIVNNTVRSSGGGIVVRGTNNTISGNSILGVIAGEDSANQSFVNGIYVGIYGGQEGAGGHCGTNLIVDGNYVDVSGPEYRAVNTAPDGIRVDSPAINAQITNNSIKGFPQRGIALRGDGNSKVTIARNFIDRSGQVDIADGPRSRPAIFIKPMGSNPRLVNRDITIDRNTVVGGLPESTIAVSGGLTVLAVSDDIRIRWNIADLVNLSIGKYGRNIDVHGNRTDGGDESRFLAGD